MAGVKRVMRYCEFGDCLNPARPHSRWCAEHKHMHRRMKQINEQRRYYKPYRCGMGLNRATNQFLKDGRNWFNFPGNVQGTVDFNYGYEKHETDKEDEEKLDNE